MRAPNPRTALDRTTWTLTWRLTRAGGRTGLLSTSLSVAAAAISTALLLLCVAVNLGFQQRADRIDWRTPVKSAAPVAVEAVGTTFSGGTPVTVVDVAQLPGKKAPAPPGMPRFPEPGEVWVSPALADLFHRLPADRHPVPGTAAETLGRAALAHPGELVAVVGHRPTAAAVTTPREDDARRPGDTVTPTRVADFTGQRSTDGIGSGYVALAKIATILVVVPLLVLGASSARLSVSRRDQRLAALRLIGATPGRIAGMTAAEAALTGAAGALLGTIGYGLLLPATARVSVAGGSWYAADLWVGLPVLLAVLAGVVAMVVVSALVGLRQVVVGPLGVARRSKPPRMSFLRALAFVAVILGYSWYTEEHKSDVSDVNGPLVFFALVFLALSVIGPWVVGVLGRIICALAQKPATLLAGRRLLDDPKSGWRTVSGLTLAGFVAGFFALFGISGVSPWGHPDTLAMAVPKARVAVVQQEARHRLEHAGVTATVGTDTDWVAQGGENTVQVVATVPGGTEKLDRARTALTSLVPGQYPVTGTDVNWSTRLFADDFAAATRVVLGVTFITAIASAGITAASSVLDRRRTYGLLRLAGTPLRTLDAARRKETLLPVAVLAGGAALTGIFTASPLTLGSGTSVDTGGMALLALCFGVGVAGLLAAGALSRPLLRSVTEQSGPRPE
ncbi:FtsX-like permease family protein [Streptomyces europaeiscabiei]|uniref:ABC transporter permease n=1 Tax=Streptomyces europaeiscabiei TaxID=146819 RepID=A0ABU4NIC7_9ACTN|nr:FtsX-like permease family protein [Streptomyces europaeiscabiei]MDX3544169.1 ABC transporter permease [Streptomyces europaeiscabiei]MDX3552403.1 ABC transporter permease [Streptomyces europaeiscabiei]MDX3701195.1 ABC transporter permease [Streptomyces europaeiscabiei]MDX3779150.1 ABC transporter permease [Streptomyces europaeiscabiei]